MNFDQTVTKNTLKAQAESDTKMVNFLSKCHQRLADIGEGLIGNKPVLNYERRLEHIGVHLVNTRVNQPVLKNQYVFIIN